MVLMNILVKQKEMFEWFKFQNLYLFRFLTRGQNMTSQLACSLQTVLFWPMKVFFQTLPNEKWKLSLSLIYTYAHTRTLIFNCTPFCFLSNDLAKSCVKLFTKRFEKISSVIKYKMSESF